MKIKKSFIDLRITYCILYLAWQLLNFNVIANSFEKLPGLSANPTPAYVIVRFRITLNGKIVTTCFDNHCYTLQNMHAIS